MDFGHEEFQDGMADCTETSLAVRRALACLNRTWHTKVRASFLKQEVLKLKPKEPDVYKVERILNDKLYKGERLYLVKWEGYPDSANSWEPEESFLDKSLITIYEANKSMASMNLNRTL